MLVRNWMTRNVVTVDAEDSMHDALAVLKESGHHLLPVMEDGRLVGILSDGDLKTASPSKATTLDIRELVYLTSRIRVRQLMSPAPVCVGPDATIEEAAEVLTEKRFQGLPVTDGDGMLVGIITKSDIFRVLLDLSGQGKRGLQIAVRLDDEIGPIKEVRDIINRHGSRTASILSSAEEIPGGKKTVYFRIYSVERKRLSALLDEIRNWGEILYVVDHRDGSREVFES